MKSISMGVIALATAGLTLAASKTAFEDLQSTTSAVKIHADAVNTIYGTTGYDWNAEHLQAIRDETNRIGQDLRKLQESPLTPTEERALNHAIPILQTMAANASSAIQALNDKGRPVENNGPVFNGNFHDRMLAVEANAAQAEKIFQSLRPYEETRGTLESRQDQKANPNAGQPQEAGR
ncbi:MAG: hypothetical protein M3N41_13490 [Acidobacteriota bacterium]|nr:hypothetical protein [Acidobacteriota bacterium]